MERRRLELIAGCLFLIFGGGFSIWTQWMMYY